MDPQQRLLLECSIGAIQVDSRDAKEGRNVGVYLGMWASEYSQVLSASPLASSAYTNMSSSCSAAAGRISFVFGVHGPCVSYDTACCSTLVACHAGTRALQHCECESALLTAANMIFSPLISCAIAMGGFTSPTGGAHTFDNRADGYVRGEACGAVELCPSFGMPTSISSVSGNAVRQDGRSASFTAPNGLAQTMLILATYVDAGILPDRVSTVEAHGTGTALGDPIEVQAVAGANLPSLLALSGVSLCTMRRQPPRHL